MKVFKILTITIITMLLIAFLLKPSIGRFKEFGADLNIKPYKVVFRKTGDYLLYAYFEKLVFKEKEYSLEYEQISKERYIGYLLNFHRIK